MNTVPEISVVIPAYNAAETIRSCIEAVLALDFPGPSPEVIVVDNGSSDDTRSIIACYPVVRVEERKRGPAAARNAGIRMARGDIIAFTDADCVPVKTWLRELLKGSEDERIGCFAGEFAPYPQRRIIAEYVHDRGLIVQKALLSYVPPVVAGGNVAYRRAVFEKAGLFDECFLNGEDGELSWRMQKHGGFAIRYNERAVVFHRHPATVRKLLTRAYREGTGLSRFRVKHRLDFSAKAISLQYYRIRLAATAAGLGLYPLRLIRCRIEGMPLRKSLLYPFLDKGCALAREMGVLLGLPRRRASRQ